MDDSKNMSKDRLKEEIKSIKNKKTIFFWIALSLILPALMMFVMIIMIGGSGAPGAGYLMIAGVVVLLIGLILGKKYLDYKKKYQELREKL